MAARRPLKPKMSNPGLGKSRWSVSEVETFHHVLFLRSASSKTALDLWEVVSSTSPQQYQMIGPGQSNAQGVIEHSTVQIMVQPSRVDCIYTGRQKNPGDPLPTPFTDFDSAFKEAVAHTQKLISLFEIGRVAALCQGFTLADTLGDAVKKVQNSVPNLPIADGVDDVIFQIVTSVKLKAEPERMIKRLCRWQTARSQTLTLPNMGMAAPQFGPSRLNAVLYIDVFYERMDELTTDKAKVSIQIVSDLAVDVLRRGYNAVG